MIFNTITSNTITANISVTSNTVTTNGLVSNTIRSNVISTNTITTVNETVSGILTVNSLDGVANNQIYQTISDTANNSVGSALAFSIALG